MGQRVWRSLSAAERKELWERWRAGESIHGIARVLGRHANTLDAAVRRLGGYAPRLRRRSRLALTLAEREEISRGICARHSLRRIARALQRPASSISRELSRNGGRERYRAARADGRAWERARRPQRCRLACHPRLCALVAQKLALQWAPQQISGWLVTQFPDDQSMRVSHETIYKSLFIQARGVLKKELLAQLRSGRKMRQARAGARARQGNGQIVQAISIRERPAEAADRAVPGHWEGDLLAGTTRTHIATLMERRSRFVMLGKVPSRDSATVVRALSQRILQLPTQLRRSLTWHRGAELAYHQRFTVATNVKVYFCDPHSPWQRGSNQNTNGLLRQYFPRGKSLAHYTQTQLDAIALRLNQRLRQTLGFKTPADILNQSVASTT